MAAAAFWLGLASWFVLAPLASSPVVQAVMFGGLFTPAVAFAAVSGWYGRRERVEDDAVRAAAGLPPRRYLTPVWLIAAGWLAFYVVGEFTVFITLAVHGARAVHGAALPSRWPIVVAIAALGFGGSHCWLQRSRIKLEAQRAAETDKAAAKIPKGKRRNARQR